MLKHVGKHSNKRVVVLYRQVPGEDHMCLVVYSDLLPRMIHDRVMESVESAAGQQAKDVADVFFRSLLADGRNLLEVLHKEGFIKKVQTNQVIVTPTPASSVRLDELNSILTEMAKGEEAVKRMQELDAAQGMSGKKRRGSVVAESKEVMPPVRQDLVGGNFDPSKQYTEAVLDDSALAKQRLTQAERMKSEAAQLLAEAQRLEQEAAALDPAPAKVTNVKKSTAKKTTSTKVKTN